MLPQPTVEVEDTLLDGLLEAAEDGIVVLGADRRALMCNTASEHLFGYSRAELFDRDIQIPFTAAFRERCIAYIQNKGRKRSTKLVGSNREELGLHRDGNGDET